MSRPFSPGEELALRIAAKRELRTRMKALRGALGRDARAARSHAITEHVTQSAAFRDAAVVAAFAPMPSEPDASLLADAARRAGKRVVLPRVGTDDDELVLHHVDAATVLVPAPMGYLEPPLDAPRAALADVALVIVPALAADERGHRLGWGRGYYDRLLARMPHVRSIALVYDWELVAELPDTPGDVRVELIATDRRLVPAREE